MILNLQPVRPPHYLEKPFESWTVTGLAFSPDGRYLAAGGWDFEAALFDAHSGRLLTLIGDESYLDFQRAEFTPDSRRLALVSDGIITLWDLHSKRNVLSLFVTGDDVIDQLRFDPTGERLFITVQDSCKIYSAPRTQ